MNKPSLAAITDTAVKITTALVIAKCLYIGWAFRWDYYTLLTCTGAILFILFFTTLALRTRRLCAQAVLGLSWLFFYPNYSIFADRICHVDSPNIFFGFFLLILSAPAMLNIIYRHGNDIETIRRSARDFHTPRRDALLPYFYKIGVFVAFVTLIYAIVSLIGTVLFFRVYNIFCVLFILLLVLYLLPPLPAALVRRLKARHAAVQSPLDTPQENQNNETAVADKPAPCRLGINTQSLFCLSIVILFIITTCFPKVPHCPSATFLNEETMQANDTSWYFTRTAVKYFIICLIIGIIEELILLYKLRKETPPPQTPAAKHPADNSPAPAIPASVNSINRVAPQNFTTQTSKAPLLRVQQSQSQKQKNARARNALLQGLGIIILLILLIFLFVNIAHHASSGNLYTYDRRF